MQYLFLKATEQWFGFYSCLERRLSLQHPFVTTEKAFLSIMMPLGRKATWQRGCRQHGESAKFILLVPVESLVEKTLARCAIIVSDWDQDMEAPLTSQPR